MLFILFVVITLLEIYVMITVGSYIGAFSTILLIIITALIGSFLLKQQGWQTFNKIQSSIAKAQSPNLAVLEGFIILISGILLLTPGFITDTAGLLGLIPQSRQYFINNLFKKNANRFFKKRNYIFINRKENTNSNNKKDNKKYTVDGEFWED